MRYLSNLLTYFFFNDLFLVQSAKVDESSNQTDRSFALLDFLLLNFYSNKLLYRYLLKNVHLVGIVLNQVRNVK